MLIVSKYHDYYDTALGFGGIDKTIVYDRIGTATYVPIEIPTLNRPRYFKTPKFDIEYYFSIIGFCGKLYPYIKKKTRKLGEYEWNVDHIFDAEEIDTILKDIVFKWYSKFKSLDEILTAVEKANLFVEHKVPSFIAGDIDYSSYNLGTEKWITKDLTVKNIRANLVLNPKLKEFGFYKIFDSYGTFQEIQMFLSGVLGLNDKPIVEVSNEQKILQAGFDLKTSFRKV